MRNIRVRWTIRSLMIVLIFVAILMWWGRSIWTRAPVNVSTLNANGITFRLLHPVLSARGGVGSGSGRTPKGVDIAWVVWTDGAGVGELLEYEKGAMRLYLRGEDYGPVQKGDVVVLDSGELFVNGRARRPAAGRPKKRPPVWVGPGTLIPADLGAP